MGRVNDSCNAKRFIPLQKMTSPSIVVFDFDAAGRVLGIEMLDVSQRTDNPRELAMELVGV